MAIPPRPLEKFRARSVRRRRQSESSPSNLPRVRLTRRHQRHALSQLRHQSPLLHGQSQQGPLRTFRRPRSCHHHPAHRQRHHVRRRIHGHGRARPRRRPHHSLGHGRRIRLSTRSQLPSRHLLLEPVVSPRHRHVSPRWPHPHRLQHDGPHGHRPRRRRTLRLRALLLPLHPHRRRRLLLQRPLRSTTSRSAPAPPSSASSAS